MSKRDPLPASAAVVADADEVLATAFALNHPAAALRHKLTAAALAVLVLGLADYLAVFRLMAQKLVDPLTGEPSGDIAGLVALSSVTVVGYVVLGALAARPQRLAKAAALAVYAVVLVLLGTAIAPAEISAIRETWSSLAGSDGGFGTNSADTAPAWFVGPSLAALTVGYSLFGLALVLAERWLARLLSLRQLRLRALATLAQAEAARAADAERQQREAVIAALETPATAAALRQAALRQGLEAYRAVIAAREVALQAALADPRTPKTEKQALAALLADAGACRNAIPTAL